MKFVVTCPRCGIDHDMPEETVGKKLRCKECGNMFRVQQGVTQPSSPAHKPFYTFTILPESNKPIGQLVDRPRPTRQAYSPPADPHPLGATRKKTEPLFPFKQLDEGEKILAGLGFAFMIFGAFGLFFPLIAAVDPSLRGVARIVAIIGICLAGIGATALAGSFRRFPGWAAGLGGLGGIVSIFIFFLVITPLLRKTPVPYKPLVQDSNNTTPQQSDGSNSNEAEQDDSEARANKPATRHPYEAPKASTNDFVIHEPDIPRDHEADNRPPTRPPNAGNRPGAVLDDSNQERRKPPSDDEDIRPPTPLGPDVPADTPGVVPRTNPQPDEDDVNPYVQLPETKVRGNDGLVHNDLEQQRKNEERFRDMFGQPGWMAAAPKHNVYASASPANDRKYQLTLEAQALSTVLRSMFGPRLSTILPSKNLTIFAGRDGQSKTVLFHPEKVPVVGMRFATDTWRGSERIALMNPVFDRNAGDVDVLARDEYAIAGLEVNAGSCIDGFRVIFMKIQGDQFDSSDSYSSQWFGIPTDQDESILLGGDGGPVYGFYLKHGLILDGVALITDP